MRAAEPAGASDHGEVVALSPVVRRVIAARVRDRHVVDDLVQETLTRVMEARRRLEPRTLAPYAVVTARNLVASLAESESRSRRHAHRLVDLREPELPENELLRREESEALSAALERLPTEERETLVAHVVQGRGHQLAGGQPPVDPWRDRHAARPHPGQAPRRVPARPGAERAADATLPPGPAGHLRRGPAASARP